MVFKHAFLNFGCSVIPISYLYTLVRAFLLPWMLKDKSYKIIALNHLNHLLIVLFVPLLNLPY